MEHYAVYGIEHKSKAEKFPIIPGALVSGSDKAERLCRNRKYSDAVMRGIFFTLVHDYLVIAKRTKLGYVRVASIQKAGDDFYYKHDTGNVYEKIENRDDLVATLLELELAETEIANHG